MDEIHKPVFNGYLTMVNTLSHKFCIKLREQGSASLCSIKLIRIQ